MAITVTPASPIEPIPIGSKRQWHGTVTLDGSYTSGAGAVIPAARFGLTNVEHAQLGVATNLADTAVFVSGGSSLTFKVIAGSGWSEKGSAAGSGDVFPLVITGV